MSNVLQHVYEYRKLLARRDLLAGKLDPESHRRLAALERLFAPRGRDAHRRRHARCELDAPATVKAGGRVHAVQIVNVGGGGMCVAPAPRLRPGERAVVRVVNRDTGIEDHYPVQASWITRNGPRSAMGLPFVGVPLRVSSSI